MKVVDIISDGSKRGIIVGIIHVIILLFSYSSPFWLDWQLIIVCCVLFYAEQIIFGGCVLDASQYGGSEDKFYENLLTHFHIQFDRKSLQFFVRWIIPIIVFVAGYLVQHFGMRPLIHLS